VSDKIPKKEQNNALNHIVKAIDPFRSQQMTIATLLAKGDPEKERRFTLLGIQIIHSILIATIPLAILALTVILPWTGYVFSSNDISGAIGIIWIMALIFGFIGNIWTRFIKWHYFFNDFNNGMFISHLSRIMLCFGTLILFGFLLGLNETTLYAILPLFFLEEVALILTYPSTKRWNRWERVG
jgi:hypothetical protein